MPDLTIVIVHIFCSKYGRLMSLSETRVEQEVV